MKLYVNGHNIFLIVLITFLASTFLVPIVKKVAIHVGAVDKPNKRRINKVPMPTLGGLAIFFSFMLGYILFAQTEKIMLPILMGGILLIVTGIIDDINPVKAKYKLLVQIIASLVVVLYGKLNLGIITIFGLTLNILDPFNSILTVFFMIGIMNVINLIDGLDGLSSGISLIYFITIAIIALALDQLGGLDVTLCLIMIGATLGFLVHNFPPAKIFVGDTGSYFLGYIIAVISLLGFKNVTLQSLIIPLIILAVPILDTFFAIIRRVLKGQKIFTPDKEHFHHQLLKLNKSQTKTVLIAYIITILFATTSILYVLKEPKQAIIIYIALAILLLFFILKTNILFEHNGKKRKKTNEKK